MKIITYIILFFFICANSFGVLAENSIPPRIDGPITSSSQAFEAIKYFSARESSLAPCGNTTFDAKKVGKEWLVFVTVEGYKSKAVSWRVWQIEAESGEYVNVTNFNWKTNIEECKNA
ncbi:hypothetical protein P886_2004 [Alteromonadaceae bacterium 2753L.S.0a.02]|nr:hypothetical protein P886_2004 [Alteromonadaceae bacterium 2753L.S.0a.02]